MSVNEGQTVRPPEQILAGPALTCGPTADGKGPLSALASKWLREKIKGRKVK